MPAAFPPPGCRVPLSAALLAVCAACSGAGAPEPLGPGGEPLDEPLVSADSSDAPGAGAGDAARQLGEPSPAARALTGGQTGSDIVPESATPCSVISRTEYTFEARTPLGVSGADVAALLTPRNARISWATGAPVAVTLAFGAGPQVTLLERAPSGPVPCVDVLQVPVQVTLSSSEPGVEAQWSSFAYVDADRNLAGVGLPEMSELGAELRARSGGVVGLELRYEIADGVWRGWLTAGADENSEESAEPPPVVAAISEQQ